MSAHSRSQFLAGAAGAALFSLAEWARPVAAQPAPAKLSDIDHIVILMQENRSFDHYYGTLPGVRGFDEAKPLLLPDGRPVFYQPDAQSADGFVLPFRLDTQTTTAQRLHDLSHSWGPLHASWNRGRMNQWVKAHRVTDGDAGPLSMGYYTRADIPFYYALAEAFTVCDGYHASVMGPTNPNRYYGMSAFIDPEAKFGGPATNNRGKRYAWPTYPEALDRAGITWRIYRPEISPKYPVGLDVIMNFAKFQDAVGRSGFYEHAAKQRSTEMMLDDIRTGNLPQVTWIVPPFEASDHPNMLPAEGANYVHRILQAFWSNPALWSRTAFVLVYDENDGLFDHVVPPTPPPGTPGEFIDGLPIGLGFRVPCVVISPFSRGGFVCGDTFDHTSTLRLIEARFGVEIPNLTTWRRDTCGDLTTAFAFGTPPDTSIPVMPETSQALAVATQLLDARTLPAPAVPSQQAMPAQERGPGLQRRKAAGAILRAG